MAAYDWGNALIHWLPTGTAKGRRSTVPLPPRRLTVAPCASLHHSQLTTCDLLWVKPIDGVQIGW